MTDLRLACRQLARAPAFTATVVLTLALGIAVNAIVLLFVSDLFLRPLAVHDPDRLVFVMQQTQRVRVPLGFSYPDYQDFAAAVESPGTSDGELASAFSGLLLYQALPVALSRPGTAAERTWIGAVSGNFFDVIGVGAAHGRVFTPAEGRQTGAEPVIVLTHATWQKRFGGDPGILGQTVSINSASCTVIGVTSPGFHGPQWTEALSGFVPFTVLPQLRPSDRETLENRGKLGPTMMGRLRPGVTLAQARVAADLMLAQLIQRHPDEHVPAKAVVLAERVSRPAPQAAGFAPFILSVLMFGALLVLAVAVANAMNLLFARAVERQRELAVRSALGASRGRLVQQLVVESVLTALVAGGLGVLLAAWADEWLSRTLVFLSDTPPAAEHGSDWRFFAATAALTLVVGIIAALVPALKATRHAILPLLNAGGIATTAGRQRGRAVLVVAQVALSCIVLIAAGLCLRSARALAQVHPGFESPNLLLASYDLELQGYVARHGVERARQFHHTLLDQVRTLPGVRHASLSTHLPFELQRGGANLQGSVTAEGVPLEKDTHAPMTPVVPVEREYLRTMGIPLRAGRDFAATDTEAAPRVAIINEAMATRLWPGEEAIGRRLIIGGRPPHEVVGVTRNGRYLMLAEAGSPHVFVPLEQNFRGAMTLFVRTEGNPLALAPAVERVVRQLEPGLPLYNVRTMEQQISQSPMGLFAVRFGAAMVGLQGALALVLALSGIYGLVAFNVARRTREIGLRMALGANPARVLRLVATQSVRLTLVGLALGLAAATLLLRPLGQLLYGVAPNDVLVFASVTALILAIAFAACWLPARRATRTNPVDALRAE
jgi:predicted permease